jgi:hypothetical protein
MNKIGLDISKVSTAMSIEVNKKNYLFSYNTLKITQQWNKILSNIENIKIRTYFYDNKIQKYSESEINKLITFIRISNDLITDILSVIDVDDDTIIYIEGYSYGRTVNGPLLDLVGIGATIRSKLYENIPNIQEIKIIAPKSLKLFTAEMIYGAEIKDIGKRKEKIVKIINKNNNDVSGGDFKKIDMYYAIKESNKEHLLKQLFEELHEKIIKTKSFPKPLEDLNDAFLLKELIDFIPLEI